jgi:glycosyltransferase involved in cell wall biosynthesis
MKPLRIIVTMIEAPLPFGSAPSRWYYVLLRELVARGYQVTAFAACSKLPEIEQARQLFPAPQYDLRLYPFPHRRGWRAKFDTLRQPYSYMFSPDLKRDLAAELARGFDILHLEQLWSGWLGLEYLERAVVNVHHLVWIDLEHACPPTLLGRLHRWLMFRAERILVRRFQYFRACSPRLVPEILRENPQAHVVTVPVGIDCSLYDYIPDHRRSGQPVISVIGNMGWYPTYSAAVRLLTRLWPLIKKQVPQARVQLVGWGARTALKEYLDMPDVSIHEDVPDTRPYFEQTATLLYAPARGSGMKIKILEALAYGVPVVTTWEGVEGLPAQDGVHAGICDDEAGLIERTVRLLQDSVAQNHQRAAGRALVESHCSPQATVDAIVALYDTIGQARGSG